MAGELVVWKGLQVMLRGISQASAFVMASNSSSVASARVAVAIALQPVNT